LDSVELGEGDTELGVTLILVSAAKSSFFFFFFSFFLSSAHFHTNKNLHNTQHHNAATHSC